MIQVRDGLVEVRAPFNIQQKEIDLFISQKENWIMKKLFLKIEKFLHFQISFLLSFS